MTFTLENKGQSGWVCFGAGGDMEGKNRVGRGAGQNKAEQILWWGIRNVLVYH